MTRWTTSLACLLAAAAVSLAALRPTQGRPAGGPLKRFDTILEGILRDHKVAGASLAIAKDGRLVLARGYGLADVAKNEPVRPDHLFCIASVTKSVTAVAVLKLVEEGKLGLDDTMVSVLKRHQPLGEVIDPRVRQITVRHLLHHAAGWDVAKRGQPPASMVKKARELGVWGPLTTAICYRIALGERLDLAPGTDNRYSNFGFTVLRLVVEEASGQDYESYVRAKVLAPMGIRRMRLELRDYGPGETRRYDVGGRKLLKGGYPVHRGERADREPGGNWVASASDLVRFVTALDGSRGKPFLKRRTTAEMLAVPPPPYKKALRPADPHVGLGWDRVQKVGGDWRYSKNGGRPGVSAWLEHLPGGVSWAVLFNTSADKEGDGTPLREARQRIPAAVEQVKAWPKRDLFE